MPVGQHDSYVHLRSFNKKSMAACVHSAETVVSLSTKGEGTASALRIVYFHMQCVYVCRACNTAPARPIAPPMPHSGLTLRGSSCTRRPAPGSRAALLWRAAAGCWQSLGTGRTAPHPGTLVGLQDAVTSSGARTSAESESSRLPHREVASGLLVFLPSILKGPRGGRTKPPTPMSPSRKGVE